MTDTRVVVNRQFFNSRDDVEVTDGDVVFNHALIGVDNADSDTNPFADLIAKNTTIETSLQE
jgi:hypothetical protein